MKVMTFNIWNYTPPWKRRRELLARIIDTYQPAAVALQETRHDFRYEGGRNQGEQIAALTGYHATLAVGQVYIPFLRVDEALTILSQDPPRRTEVCELTQLPAEREDENRRVCLGVTLSSNGREVHVFNTHFSLSAVARMHNAVEVSRFVRRIAGDAPAVLMGDLNAEPSADSISLLVGRRRTEDETGDFVDCWQQAHPADSGYTYASFDPVRRIDYVLARGVDLAGISAQIVGQEPDDGLYASDHLGILVEFSV